MGGQPVAYIRRSVSRRNDPGDISRQFQADKVRELAGIDGPTLVVIDQDWGRSAAGDKTDRRLAFLELLASVERGEVSTLYAYSADRLARSVRWAAQLLDACETAGTTIVTGEGRFAPGDDQARQMFHFQAMQNEGTLRQMTAKARSAVAARSNRGDALGRPPYGYMFGRDDSGRVILVPDPEQPIQPVLDAFNEAGSFNGAARLLNQRKLPGPRGGKWAGNVVNRVVRRERPGLVPRRSEPRVAALRGSHVFSRLLRCSCGRILTPRTNRRVVTPYGIYGPYTGYQCYAGRHDPSHPRPYMVAEPIILEWAKAEAARFRRPDATLAMEMDRDGERDRLEDRRTRYAELYGEGEVDRAKWHAVRDEIDAKLASLDAETGIVAIPERIPWDRPDDVTNAALRALWEYVQLGPDMRPVEAVWRVKEWRRD